MEDQGETASEPKVHKAHPALPTARPGDRGRRASRCREQWASNPQYHGILTRAKRKGQHEKRSFNAKSMMARPESCSTALQIVATPGQTVRARNKPAQPISAVLGVTRHVRAAPALFSAPALKRSVVYEAEVFDGVLLGVDEPTRATLDALILPRTGSSLRIGLQNFTVTPAESIK
jgi:hypothetical protein